LGVAATGLDVGSRALRLADGSELAGDGVVLACGATPRTLPGAEVVDGVHTVRTLDDATALRDAVRTTAGPVVVVGAGFIGAEVAATCRTIGRAVVLVEPLAQPLARVLGPTIGAVFADLHRSHGVDLRLGVGVARVVADGHDRVCRVELTDGSALDTATVVVGIGVTPNTGWLADSGLTIDDGIVCDATCTAAPGIVAAGDVARWPNPVFDGEWARIEHWDHAFAQAEHAAAS
jgi:3-phenylpropionate/trans-cinnamate dioxygenase ferredoxin reductase subunit